MPLSSEPEVQVDFSRPGFRFLYEKDGFTFTVEPSKLVVETDQQALHCGVVLSAILRKLPQTPLIAVGNNYIFEANQNADKLFPWLSNIPHHLEGKEAFKVGASVNLHNSDGRLLLLQVFSSSDKTDATVNYERRDSRAEALAKAADAFADDMQASCQLLNKLFNVTCTLGPTYEPHNPTN